MTRDPIVPRNGVDYDAFARQVLGKAVIQSVLVCSAIAGVAGVVAIFVDSEGLPAALEISAWVVALVAVLAVVTIGVVFRFLALTKNGSSGRVFAQRRYQPREYWAELVAAIVTRKDASRPIGTDFVALAIKDLTIELGVATEEHGRWEPQSEYASAFLVSLEAYLRSSSERFALDWRAVDRNDQKQIAAAVRVAELRRIRSDDRPTRTVSASLCLVASRWDEDLSILMLENPMWVDGGYWFPGGTEEPVDDGNPANTLKRELEEELGVAPTELLFMKKLGPVSERMISRRVGLFTEYRFEIFVAQIEPLVASNRGFSNSKQGRLRTGVASQGRSFRWFSWSELMDCEHLRSATPQLRSFLVAREKEVSKYAGSVSQGRSFVEDED